MGFGVWDFKVQGLGFRFCFVFRSKCRMQKWAGFSGETKTVVVGSRVLDFELRVSVFGFRVVFDAFLFL